MAKVCISCGECGIEFDVPDHWYQNRREKKTTWWCPNGHPRAFLGMTEAQRLKEELDRAQQRVTQLQAENAIAWEEVGGERRRAAAARGQVTKLKKRAAAGVCPCCNRTFVNLQRHMASKHAGFLAEEVQAEVGKAVH